jgi:hypothetical protein
VARAAYDVTSESPRPAVAGARAGRAEKARPLNRLAGVSPAR